jgi:hypothetical protein
MIDMKTAKTILEFLFQSFFVSGGGVVAAGGVAADVRVDVLRLVTDETSGVEVGCVEVEVVGRAACWLVVLGYGIVTKLVAVTTTRAVELAISNGAVKSSAEKTAIAKGFEVAAILPVHDISSC